MCVDDDEPKWYETYTIKQMEIEQTVEFVFSLARARKNTIQFIFSSHNQMILFIINIWIIAWTERTICIIDYSTRLVGSHWHSNISLTFTIHIENSAIYPKSMRMNRMNIRMWQPFVNRQITTPALFISLRHCVQFSAKRRCTSVHSLVYNCPLGI